MNQRLLYNDNKIWTNQEAIYVQIRFGNPTSGDCRNFGICKMEFFDGTVNEFQKRTGYALARFIILNEKKQIIFEKSSMNKASQELYFGNGFFVVEAEVTLGEGLSRKLEIKNTFLRAGKYPIIETLTSFILTL